MSEKVDIKSDKNKLEFKKFEDIPVSTKTYIVMTNICLDIKKLFDFLPITNYIVVPKRRGRKKKIPYVEYNKNIPDGSIITIDLANRIKGVLLKKKKDTKSTDYFRNSITIVMIMEDKKINFKISNNGKFQMTGVKQDHQAENCVKTIWNLIKDKKDIYKFHNEEKEFNAIFIPAMRNIDFSLGFILDREKLDEYFNTSTKYSSLLETSIGYTGVNIKIPIEKDISELNIKQLLFKNNEWKEPIYIKYKSYLEKLAPKDKQKKIDKDRFNTFLVFHSGKVIMSSMCEEFAKDTYYEFIDIIKNNYKKFQENLS